MDVDDRYAGKSGQFEALDKSGDGPGPQRSIEGWIIFVSGVHEEAQEDDLHDKFSEVGEIENLQEAQAAIEAMKGGTFLEQVIDVDWAFSKGPLKRKQSTRRRTSPTREKAER